MATSSLRAQLLHLDVDEVLHELVVLPRHGVHLGRKMAAKLVDPDFVDV
jgi:hypothetical protein